ncbi:MAG TPA: sulfotransferase family 2 domain-containing protein [Xanthobacteraceae bacterium]|nr:sulfotransferase family 2 domain-containing protein [Xanthobacteraceae bacterium]
MGGKDSDANDWKRRLIIHIPKCAGTSIEVAAGFDRDYPTLGLRPTSTKADRARLFGDDLQHLSIREIEEGFLHDLQRPISYSFSIVRDPIERFVSHFVWRTARFAAHDEARLDGLVSDFNSFFEEFRALANASDFFVEPRDGISGTEGNKRYLHTNDIFRHLVPQYCFVSIGGRVAIDELFLIHQIDLVQSILSQKADVERKIPHRMVGASSKALRNRLSPAVESELRQLYKLDYNLLKERSPER